MQCQLKNMLKRKVFSFVLKVVKDLQLLISTGREFHNTLALSPAVFGSQFDFLLEFAGHLMVFPWIRKDFN